MKNRSEPRRIEPESLSQENPFGFPEAEAKNNGLEREELCFLRRHGNGNGGDRGLKKSVVWRLGMRIVEDMERLRKERRMLVGWC